MNILIYGGTSYIGSCLANYLLTKGHKVGNVSRQCASSPLIDNFNFEDDIKYVVDTFQPDKIVYMSTCFNNKNIEEIVDVNIRKPLNIIKYLEFYQCEYNIEIEFIHIGSYWQLGDANLPNIPIDLYSCSKKTISVFTDYYNTYSNLRCKEVVLYGTYGDHDGRGKLLDYLIESAKKNVKVKLSPGDQKLNLVNVVDISHALLTIIDNKNYNKFIVRSDKEYSVKELVDKVKEYIPLDAEFGSVPYRKNELMIPVYGKDYCEIIIEDNISDYIYTHLM
jgi:CDP-paratose synthetase